MQINTDPEYLKAQGFSKTFAERFRKFIPKSLPKERDLCWQWRGAKTPLGYGCINVGRHSGNILAHRASWVLHYGPIPHGLCVCHRCDVPGCVRPSHLFLGTKKDNTQDMILKGRKNSATGERHASAKLTQRDVIEIRERCKLGRIMQKAIAKQFGLHPSNVSRIISRQNWAHI